MTESSKSPNCVRSVETKMAAKNDADESSDASVRRVLGATTAQDDTTEPLQVHHARSLILRLSVLVGNLCSIFLQSVPLDGSTAADTDAPSRLQDTPGLQDSMAALVLGLTSTAKALSIDLETAVLKKMELNGKKYPVELCTVRRRQRIDVHTVFSIHTSSKLLVFRTHLSLTPTIVSLSNLDHRERLENIQTTLPSLTLQKTKASQRFMSSPKVVQPLQSRRTLSTPCLIYSLPFGSLPRPVNGPSFTCRATWCSLYWEN